MTTNILLTYGYIDAKGKKYTVPVYGTFDEATATLAQLMAYASVTLTKLDPITEGQAQYVAMTLYPALPGSGIKTAPVVNSDAEESGLMSYSLTSVGNRSYGQDIGAFDQTKFLKGLINTGDTAVQAWRDQMINHATVVVPTNDYWLSTLSTLVKGVKSFRKKGKRSRNG